jgi:hypothetical protein
MGLGKIPDGVSSAAEEFRVGSFMGLGLFLRK